MSGDTERARPEEVKSSPAASGTPVFAGTVTILFSDIRGFTDYTEKFGDDEAHQMLRQHDAIVKNQVKAFGGQVVKNLGDGFMVAFTAARAAILCAFEIQRDVGALQQNSSGAEIAIGIGINTGDLIKEESGDYRGRDVNLASRICAAARPGQILVAESTRYIAQRIEARELFVVEYVDRGEHKLKGFEEAQRLWEPVRRPREAAAQPGGAPPAAAEEEIAAFKAAVQQAIGVLTRVLAVTHLDDPAFSPLLECQANASKLRFELSRAGVERRGFTAKEVLEEAIPPFEKLLTLIFERDTLNEERWAELEASVAREFGRPLVIAAARGRLSVGASEKPEAAPTATRPEVPTGQRTSAPQALAPLPPDPRAAAVRWWAGACGAWSQWKPSGLGWAYALRLELSKYPYLLSVHVRASAEHDDGQLAGGYFLLLEHVENQSPSFMRTAVERAIELAGGSQEPRALGPKLYQLLVDGGRLRETYPGLVRDIIAIAVPNPGMWADGGVIEHEDATVVVTRPTSTIGDTQERAERLTEPNERTADRSFEVTLQPLTTRFFYVKPGELKTPRDLEFRLTADGQPSDRAWYLTLKTSLLVHSEPKRLPAAGVSLPGLGRDHAGAWVAVFNPDPDEVVTHELIVSLRQPRPPMQRWSAFAPRGARGR